MPRNKNIFATQDQNLKGNTKNEKSKLGNLIFLCSPYLLLPPIFQAFMTNDQIFIVVVVVVVFNFPKNENAPIF